MVSGEEDFTKRFIGKVDLRWIKGVLFRDPTFSACVPISVENTALAYDALNDRFKVDIEALTVGTLPVDVSDRWARLVGKIDLQKFLGSDISLSNPILQAIIYNGAIIDPRNIRALTSSDAMTLYGSQTQKLLQRATTYDTLVQLRHNGVEINPTQIRALTSSDVVTVDNLLNPHPVEATQDGTWTVTAQQTTRTSLKAQIEREDLTNLGGVVSPNNAGVQIVAANGTKKVKVFDAGYHAGVDGLHYFYFGTSTTATTRRFCTCNKAFLIHKSFPHPRISNASDGLYLFSSVAETNMPYDINYVQE